MRVQDRRLWREVTEQLFAVVDCAVTVAVEGEPRIVGAGNCLRKTFRDAVAVEVEADTIGVVGQFDAVAVDVDDDR